MQGYLSSAVVLVNAQCGSRWFPHGPDHCLPITQNPNPPLTQQPLPGNVFTKIKGFEVAGAAGLLFKAALLSVSPASLRTLCCPSHLMCPISHLIAGCLLLTLYICIFSCASATLSWKLSGHGPQIPGVI